MGRSKHKIFWQDRQTVDETEYHGVRHKLDKFAELQKTDEHLDQTHQNDRRERIFNAVPRNERDDDSNRARCAGDHSRSAAENCRNQFNDKSRIKPDQRAYIGDDRKSDRFRHECERDR